MNGPYERTTNKATLELAIDSTDQSLCLDLLIRLSFEKTWVTLSITSLMMGGYWIFYSIYIAKFNHS